MSYKAWMYPCPIVSPLFLNGILLAWDNSLLCGTVPLIAEHLTSLSLSPLNTLAAYSQVIMTTPNIPTYLQTPPRELPGTGPVTNYWFSSICTDEQTEVMRNCDFFFQF